MYRCEYLRKYPTQKQREGNGKNNRYVNRNDILNGLFKIGINSPSSCNPYYQFTQIIIGNDQSCRRFCYIRSFTAHRYANMGGFQCRTVVNTVTQHSHHFTALFKRVYHR